MTETVLCSSVGCSSRVAATPKMAPGGVPELPTTDVEMGFKMDAFVFVLQHFIFYIGVPRDRPLVYVI